MKNHLLVDGFARFYNGLAGKEEVCHICLVLLSLNVCFMLKLNLNPLSC